jgi:3-oxoadipate enol-lactonase
MKRAEPMISRVTSLAGALISLTLLLTGIEGLGGERGQVGMAEVNGTKLYYEMAGKGPTVVLVHGGLVDSRLWDDQMQEFSRHYQVVRYDLRGFGNSSAATESFSHIEDLRALLDFLKIEHASIVGLSLGGIIAADFTLEHPERVERLVLVGAGLRGDKQPQDKEAIKVFETFSKGAEPFADVVMKSALYAAVRPGTQAYVRLKQMILDNFKALATLRPGFLQYPEPPTIERLRSIRVPTLVVIGGEDAQNLKNISDTLTTKIPGARKVVIAGSSHHPPIEKPKEFNKTLLTFLRRS